jgi:hypothetical protein
MQYTNKVKKERQRGGPVCVPYAYASEVDEKTTRDKTNIVPNKKEGKGIGFAGRNYRCRCPSALHFAYKASFSHRSA